MRTFVTLASNIISLLSFFACITAESNSSCLTETVAMFKDSGKDALSGAYESWFSNFSSLCELGTMSKICKFYEIIPKPNRKMQAYSTVEEVPQALPKNLTFDGVIDLSSLTIGTIKDACTNAAGKMCDVTVNTTVTGAFSGYSLWISMMTVGLPVCLASSCEEADLSAVFGPVIDSQMAWINSALDSLNIWNGTFTYDYLNGTCT